ncbi:MAG: aggregation factor core protein MAFp3, isoform C, partial [Sphingobacteriales bacterium]
TDDQRVENTERYTVNISGITGSATLGNAAVATDILDDDQVTVELTGTPTTTEAVGTVTYTATLTGIAGTSITSPVTVQTGIAPGSALAADYTFAPSTLTFPAGSPNGTTRTITVPIVNDLISEPSETFTATITNITGPTTISAATATATITDNDASSIAINNVTVAENAGSGTVTFTVTLTGAVQNAFTVAYASANGSAIAPGDYTAVSGTLTFAANSPTGTTRTITVPIINDLLSEGNETFTVGLSGITGPTTIATATGTATITDDDASSVAINNVTVDEAAGNAIFTVTLTGNVQNAFTVNYATANGTAVAGSDYTATTGTVTFPANSVTGATQTITIPILNDLITEATETFTVGLSGITGSTTIATATGTGTITDNDAASIAIN